MKKHIVFIFILIFIFSTAAHAASIIIGTDTTGNTPIYDDVLNITWNDYRFLNIDNFGWEKVLDGNDSKDDLAVLDGDVLDVSEPAVILLLGSGLLLLTVIKRKL